MIRAKKTLYEMLDLDSSATSQEIALAYQAQVNKFILKERVLGAEEAALQQKVVDMAFMTLSVEKSREAYDASLRKDVVQAISEKTLKVEVTKQRNSPLRGVLGVIAGVMVIWLGIQVIFMFIAYRSHAVIAVPSDIEKEAEEKLRIQQYYQENGVRVGSKAEADLLEAKQIKDDAAQRAKDIEKREQDRKYQQWLAEGRRVGDEVTRQNLESEESLRREQERELRKKDEEKQQKEEQERMRIEREKLKWSNGAARLPHYDDEANAE